MWFLYLTVAIVGATSMMFSADGVRGVSTVSEARAAQVDVVAHRAATAVRAVETKVPHNPNAFPARVSTPLNIRPVAATTVQAAMPSTMRPPMGFAFFQQADGKPAFSISPHAPDFDLVVSRLGRDFQRVWTDGNGNVYFVRRDPSSRS